MSRSPFGWDLPPGVTSRMIDEAYGTETPCECCGKMADDCICPECSVCGATGDTSCYGDVDDPRPHGLKFTYDQLIGQDELQITYLKDQIESLEMSIEHLKRDRDAS